MAAFDFPASPTDGQVYTANGVTFVWSAADTAWKGQGSQVPLSNSQRVLVYNTPGTIAYAKPAGLKLLQVEIWGGGGGSAGSPATIAGQTVASGGAGSGGYCRKLYRASELAVDEPLVVGAGGAAGTSAANGGVGGASTFKGLTANGGGLGPLGVVGTTFAITNRGGGGAASGGDLNIQGAQGQPGMRAMHGGVIAQAGVGGTAPLGGAPVYTSYPTLVAWAAVTPGNNGFGNGASGAAAAGVQSAQNGAVGNDGYAIFTEYYAENDTTSGGGGGDYLPLSGGTMSGDISNLSVSSGVKFPASQIVSADPNTLDDSERGNFTPSVDGTTAAGSGTYTFRGGRYTKTGNKVFFELIASWTAHTGTGNIKISGLPFASIVGSWGPVVSIHADSLTFSGALSATIPNGQVYLNLATITTNAASGAVAMDTSATLNIAGHYTAA